MNSQYLTDNTDPGTPYVPGEFFDVTRGITRRQFESDAGCAKSVPYEDGFFSNPLAIHRSIGVVNLSGKDVSVVLDKDKRINKCLPSSRENESELNGFLLLNGSSSHFTVPPFCYHITVNEWVESELGGKKMVNKTRI